MREVVIAAAVRTPFGRFGGSLKDVPVDVLGSLVVKEVLRRAGIDGTMVNEVYAGNCYAPEAESPSVVGRQVALKAGLPPEIFTVTVDTACCSSLTCARLGYQSIKYGNADVVLVAGVESMSRAGLIMPAAPVRWGQKLGDVRVIDWIRGLEYTGYNPVSVDAGEVALEYGVGREEQDQWALRSQQRCAKAYAEGKFNDELMTVEIPQKKGAPVILDRDEQPRPDTGLEKLAKLPTVYGSPTVTAGNAPGLNDGASAIVLMAKEKASELGIKPLATITAALGRSTKPRYIAPIPGMVIKDVLAAVNKAVDDMDVIEINEAFSAMPLVSSKVLAGGDEGRIEKIREKINVNGGAVAIGHPVGASGARIVLTMAYELRRRGGGCGVAAICGGLAQGEAMVLKG